MTIYSEDEDKMLSAFIQTTTGVNDYINRTLSLLSDLLDNNPELAESRPMNPMFWNLMFTVTMNWTLRDYFKELSQTGIAPDPEQFMNRQLIVNLTQLLSELPNNLTSLLHEDDLDSLREHANQYDLPDPTLTMSQNYHNPADNPLSALMGMLGMNGLEDCENCPIHDTCDSDPAIQWRASQSSESPYLLGDGSEEDSSLSDEEDSMDDDNPPEWFSRLFGDM